MSMAALLLVAVLALTSRQPSPPTVAEFAPQAVDQIKESPSELSSAFGSGAGGSGGDGEPQAAATTTTTTAPPPTDAAEVINVARVRACVGNPPRQIEDPQSPPCVPYWSGDNGGATSKGVTANEIRIVVPYEQGEAEGNREISKGLKALETFFNKRFELYGRKLHLIGIPGYQPGGQPDAMRADAVVADQEEDAFATLASAEAAGQEHHYYDALAERKILSVANAWGLGVDEDHFTQHQPYEWNVVPGVITIEKHVAEMVCKELKGTNADHAGSPYTGQPRVFGLLDQLGPDKTKPDFGPLKAMLKACGVELKAEAELGCTCDQFEQQTTTANAIFQLRDAGVNTVLSFVHGVGNFTGVHPTADGQGYYPEWLVNDFELQWGHLGNSPPNIKNRTFGVATFNKAVQAADQPIMWALKEVDPSLGADSGTNNEYGYWPLLVLASGIQMAGPNLTPATFQAGLFKSQFPNPGAGAPPYYQAHVGFGPGDHTFYDDAAAAWWSPNARNPGSTTPSPTGAECYVRSGARYSPGRWPPGNDAFKEPCDSGAK
jgi:hypothetical protein